MLEYQLLKGTYSIFIALVYYYTWKADMWKIQISIPMSSLSSDIQSIHQGNKVTIQTSCRTFFFFNWTKFSLYFVELKKMFYVTEHGIEKYILLKKKIIFSEWLKEVTWLSMSATTLIIIPLLMKTWYLRLQCCIRAIKNIFNAQMWA